ncbi:LOW QUALITY PROTEIN: tetraspanin-19 [Acridotheres tristis]
MSQTSLELSFRVRGALGTILPFPSPPHQALGLMLLTFDLWLLFDRNNFLVFFSEKLGIGSVITFTSAVGVLGVVEIKCLLVTMECCGRYSATQWERKKTKKDNTQFQCLCTKYNMKKWFCDFPRDSTYSMEPSEQSDWLSHE